MQESLAFLRRSSSTVARARRSVPVHCPDRTKSLPDTLRRWQQYDVTVTSSASKKSVRDITRISCFVTTMKLPHALQIYLTVSVKKCMRLHCSRQCSNKLQVKWTMQLCVCGQIISVCNSEKVIKIGQYLRKLRSNEKKDPVSLPTVGLVTRQCKNLKIRLLVLTESTNVSDRHTDTA